MSEAIIAEGLLIKYLSSLRLNELQYQTIRELISLIKDSTRIETMQEINNKFTHAISK